jgi:hypothetical protein
MELRVNEQRPPATLVPRHLPGLTDAALHDRAIAVRTLGTEIERPGPGTPRIVSSAHGRFEHILMAYPSYAGGDDVYHAIFRDLFKKLPAEVELTVVAHPTVVDEVTQLLEQERPTPKSTVVETPRHLYFSVWAEDPYVVVQDIGSPARPTFIVEPFLFERYGDTVIAELVAEATEIQATQAPLIFQGGNILIGPKFVLVGIDYLLKTWKVFASSQPPTQPGTGSPEQQVKSRFREAFDPARELIFVGTRLEVPKGQQRTIQVNGEQWTEFVYVGTGMQQPIFHIDMFISLAGYGSTGKYRLLVGSPSLADELLEREPVPQALAAVFDDVAKNLGSLGFEVHRNPLPLTCVDDPEAKERMWYFATSNNCLVQIADGEADVWLPTYGHGPWKDLEVTDNANKRIWEDLGFTVHQLVDFHILAQNLGAVHCIKKYLARSEEPTSSAEVGSN